MTTFPIAAPTSPGFTTADCRLNRVVGASRSPFSLSESFYVHPGAVWTASVALPRMRRSTMQPWAGFLNELNGVAGTFTMAPPDRKSPLGTQSANFLVAGSHVAQATSLSVSNMSAGATLLSGDRISIDQRLHEVVVDATATGGGTATLEIRPPLRVALTGGETVKCDPPDVLWRLDGNEYGPVQSEPGFYDLTFGFREVI